MNVIIESPANPRIKQLVKLRESPRHRKERGRFFVEGGEDLLTLARAGRTVEEVYFSCDIEKEREEHEWLDEFESKGVETIEISKQAYAKASYRSAGHGMIGVVRSWDLGLEAHGMMGNGPVVVLDEVEKPGNLGAILRSVEAFGGEGVILSDPTVDFFNPNVVRSSRGLMGSVPVISGSKAVVMEWLQNSGRRILATSSHAQEGFGVREDPSALAFVFGSEKWGLGEYWKKQEMEWVRIPMKGTASSLNLNVSVACLLYEHNRT